MAETRVSGQEAASPWARENRCQRCAGTGLVCGHTPVIAPGACCVDYANAICPDCGGRGVEPDPVPEEAEA
ncbi:MAG: hypothetical protein MUF52_11855 [Syntrophobacteraceae bacterium]|jgi:DnaJ-class molecular chaperone|nr:hypothetical protein [Syntrophobacteraceae bacterium]